MEHPEGPSHSPKREEVVGGQALAWSHLAAGSCTAVVLLLVLLAWGGQVPWHLQGGARAPCLESQMP